MSDDSKTIWCGNLSDKVTEDILYELFLQGGPLERVNIPKDRDGKPRSFGFITYKHVSSVPYALELFNGTSLFDRAINLQSRGNVEVPVAPPPIELNLPLNDLMQLGNQMILGSCMQYTGSPYGNPYQQPIMHPNQFLGSSYPCYNEDRRHHRQPEHRSNPYHRDHERHNNRYNNDHGRDSRREHLSSSSYRDKHRDGSHRSHRHDNRRNYRS